MLSWFLWLTREHGEMRDRKYTPSSGWHLVREWLIIRTDTVSRSRVSIHSLCTQCDRKEPHSVRESDREIASSRWEEDRGWELFVCLERWGYEIASSGQSPFIEVRDKGRAMYTGWVSTNLWTETREILGFFFINSPQLVVSLIF